MRQQETTCDRERQLEVPANLHVIDPVTRIWRSGQPSQEEFRKLAELGFRSVLNLRRFHSDREALAGTGLREYHMKTFMPAEKEMIEALRIILMAEKPLLIHCRHGSDRTGAIAAGYRIVCNNWTLEKALAEFYAPEYGYHPWLYWSLPRRLHKCDWAFVAAEVGAYGKNRAPLSSSGL